MNIRQPVFAVAPVELRAGNHFTLVWRDAFFGSKAARGKEPIPRCRDGGRLDLYAVLAATMLVAEWELFTGSSAAPFPFRGCGLALAALETAAEPSIRH